jgi:hypothetical protein
MSRAERRILCTGLCLSVGALWAYAAGLRGVATGVGTMGVGLALWLPTRLLYFATVHRGRVSPRTATIVCLILSIPWVGVIAEQLLVAWFKGADATLEMKMGWVEYVALLSSSLGCGLPSCSRSILSAVNHHPPHLRGSGPHDVRGRKRW